MTGHKALGVWYLSKESTYELGASVFDKCLLMTSRVDSRQSKQSEVHDFTSGYGEGLLDDL